MVPFDSGRPCPGPKRVDPQPRPRVFRVLVYPDGTEIATVVASTSEEALERFLQVNRWPWMFDGDLQLRVTRAQRGYVWRRVPTVMGYQ